MACDLNHSEDQRQILDAVAAMLDANYPVARLRHDRRDDLSAVAEFGAFSLPLAEDDDAAGFGLVEEALIHVMFGRHLISSGALATAMAYASPQSSAERTWRNGRRPECSPFALRCPWTISILLLDAEGAGLAVVFGERQVTLIEVDGQSGEPADGLGHGTPLTRLRSNAYGTLVQSDDETLLAERDLLVSAQLLGIAEATRDLAVSYAQVRQQFGRPIGTFQAIKHHCANMAIAAEMLSSQHDIAAIAARDGRADAAFQIAALRLLAPKAALGNARTCIQLHGGIGFSAETDAHRFLKQAHLLSRLGAGAAVLDMPAPLAPYGSTSERN